MVKKIDGKKKVMVKEKKINRQKEKTTRTWKTEKKLRHPSGCVIRLDKRFRGRNFSFIWVQISIQLTHDCRYLFELEFLTIQAILRTYAHMCHIKQKSCIETNRDRLYSRN